MANDKPEAALFPTDTSPSWDDEAGKDHLPNEVPVTSPEKPFNPYFGTKQHATSVANIKPCHPDGTFSLEPAAHTKHES